MNTSTVILFGKTPASEFGGPTEKAVYMAFSHYASEKNGFTCWPSITTIASIVGRSLATVYRAITKLKNLGWIARNERFSRGMHTTSLTTLCIDKIRGAIATLKPRKPNVSGSLTMRDKLSHDERQNIKTKYKNTFSLPRKGKKSVSTRDRTLHDDLTDTSWAT